jgi:Uma2 family endonuclease
MTFIVAKWTIDEYHRIIDAGILSDRKVELLKGEIVEMSPEGEPHPYCSDEALTGGTIQPLAFPDISVAVEQIINS